MNRFIKNLGLLALILLLLGIAFTFVITHGDMKLTETEPLAFGYNYTNALDNLKQGRFDLDPNTSNGKLAELFYRNGKIYTYYGFFPVILRGCIEIIFERGLTEWSRISALLASLLAVISFSLACYKFISNIQASKEFQAFYLVLFIIAFSLGSSLLSLLSQANLYSEVIIWALAWNGVFICAFIYFFYSPKINYLFLFLMSLSSGFVLLSRALSAISSSTILIFLFFVFICRTNRFKVKWINLFLDRFLLKNIPGTKKQLISSCIILLLPWFLCICFQLKVNYERWGNSFVMMDLRYYENYNTDAGRQERFKKWGYLHYLRIPTSFFYYFVPLSCYFKSSFPYIQFGEIHTGGLPYNLPFKHLMFETAQFDWNERGVPLTVSSFYLVLVSIVGCIALFKNLGGILSFLFLPYALHSIIMFCYMGLSLRYSSDLLPTLAILSFVSLRLFYKLEENGGTVFRIVNRIILILASILGVYAAIIVMLLEKVELWNVPLLVREQINSNFIQIENKLSGNHKREIEPIVTSNNLPTLDRANKGRLLIIDDKTIFWFNGKYWLPVRDDNKKYWPITSYGPVKMKIKFNSTVPEEVREPLLTTGKTGAGDFVYVEHLSSNKVVFGIDHWGTLGARSKPVSIDPNKFYDLEISLGSLYPNVFLNKELLNKVEVRLENMVVLEALIEFHPTTKEEVTIGECMIDVYHGASKFSGEVRKVKRGQL